MRNTVCILRSIVIVLIIFLTGNQYIIAQEDQQTKAELPDIPPPSPTAYELGKYGQIPVGLFTGTPSYDMPLYTFKTKNLSVPISVSYNSNGIKVDQVETNVGLGWSLNCGGVITRIVRGLPDEKSQGWHS